MNRNPFRWNVTMQRDDGEIVEDELVNYWGPERDDTADAVARTKAAEMSVMTGRKHVPISATYVGKAG